MKGLEVLDLIKIADREIMSSLFLNDLSLMNGQMGIAIFFALLSKNLKNQIYEEFAEELLNNICENLTKYIPVSFSNGLCGIGWGIEFLKYKGFINEDTDELLSEIDYAVMQRDPRRVVDISFETGLEGIISYVNCRINSSRNFSSKMSFDHNYIYELKDMGKRGGLCSSLNYSIPTIWNKCIDLYSHSVIDSWKKGICALSELDI